MATQRVKKSTFTQRNKAQSQAPATAPAKGQGQNTEKRLRLQLPLLSEIYKANDAPAPKLTKKMPRLEKRTGAAAVASATATAHLQPKKQQMERPNVVERKLTPVYITPKALKQMQNEITANANGAGAELKTTKQDAVSPVRRIQYHLPGEPMHDVRIHIEESKAAKAAAQTPAAAAASMAVRTNTYVLAPSEEKLHAKKREELSAKKASKATSHYFDRYLKTAYDLSTIDGVRQLEKFFFPNNQTISGNGEQQIGDNQAQSASRMLAGGTVIEHRKFTRVAQHQQVQQAQPQKAMQMVDTAKAIESRDIRAARQRTLKKRGPQPRRGIQLQMEQQQRDHQEQFQGQRPLRFAIRPQ